MRFEVPQFIERESKIVGPLTLRQFVYLAVPGAMAFFLYYLVPFSIFLFLGILLGMIGLALAFVRIGGKALPTLLAHSTQFLVAPKNYKWQKGMEARGTAKKIVFQQKEQKKKVELKKGSKVADLATKVETK